MEPTTKIKYTITKKIKNFESKGSLAPPGSVPIHTHTHNYLKQSSERSVDRSEEANT